MKGGSKSFFAAEIVFLSFFRKKTQNPTKILKNAPQYRVKVLFCMIRSIKTAHNRLKKHG